ncbi:CLUMA_CG006052, isoform A, partial [Clunio marinus]
MCINISIQCFFDEFSFESCTDFFTSINHSTRLTGCFTISCFSFLFHVDTIGSAKIFKNK